MLYSEKDDSVEVVPTEKSASFARVHGLMPLGALHYDTCSRAAFGLGFTPILATGRPDQKGGPRSVVRHPKMKKIVHRV